MDDIAPPPTADDGHPLATVEHWAEAHGQTVKISGELDIASVESVRRVLDDVTATRPAALVFDLSELRFIDSSGITLLLVTAREVGTVHMRNPTPAVRRVVEITGLGEVLPVEP
jgi:stage II sporulation protein AA (anti-sigma F factor antagonist)